MSLIAPAALGAFVACLVAITIGPGTRHSIARVRRARGANASGPLAALRALPLLRGWHPVDADLLRLAGLERVAPADVGIAKLGAAAFAAVAAASLGVMPIAIAPLAFVAFVAPSEWLRRRAGTRRDEREAAVLPLVERLLALASAGFTLEQALARVADAASPLRPTLRAARAIAALGVSPFDALADRASHDGIASLAELARELARARRAGRSPLPALVDRRESVRLARRAARLEAAAGVDGALSLVLVAAYLPALLCLVVVPLFLGLLRSLGE